MKSSTMATDFQALPASGADPAPDRFSESEKITIFCYESDVPPFVEAELVRLYQSIYSTLAKFRADGPLGNVHTYVVKKGGKVITALLYRYDKTEVKVMNEVIMLDTADVFRFANTIFTLYGEVTAISFYAVQTNVQAFPFPFQRANISEDIVVSLPATAEAYQAQLGKNTRRNTKRYLNKITQNFPSFHYDFYTMEQVDEQHIRAIIQLNRNRMAGKHKVSSLDEKETQRIIQRIRACGLVGVAIIDGRVCAGQISYLVGAHYYMDVIAHDSSYDDYWMGTLFCYLTICECIARGGQEFHFLWGQYEYKYTLLGVQRDLDHLVVYRSRAQMMRHAAMALQIASRRGLRKIKLWLCNDSAVAHFALKSLTCLRSLKRRGQALLKNRQ